MDEKIASMRQDYSLHYLDESGIDHNPLFQFRNWFDDAVAQALAEPNIMVLSTIGLDGKPASRVVLLKDITDEGLTFFTNYASRKGQEIERNPQVSLLFMWIGLQRQVRIEGKAVKLPVAESEAYFNSRPIESRVGACVSAQSTRIPDRKQLESDFENLLASAHSGTKIIKPDHWGGYLVQPHSYEFWQGRSSRLHDRIGYSLNGDGTWDIFRLSP